VATLARPCPSFGPVGPFGPFGTPWPKFQPRDGIGIGIGIANLHAYAPQRTSFMQLPIAAVWKGGGQKRLTHTRKKYSRPFDYQSGLVLFTQI